MWKPKYNWKQSQAELLYPFYRWETETQDDPDSKGRSHVSNSGHPGSKVRTLACFWHCVPHQEARSRVDSRVAVVWCAAPWLTISPTHHCVSLQLWMAHLAWWQPTSLTQKPWPSQEELWLGKRPGVDVASTLKPSAFDLAVVKCSNRMYNIKRNNTSVENFSNIKQRARENTFRIIVFLVSFLLKGNSGNWKCSTGGSFSKFFCLVRIKFLLK